MSRRQKGILLVGVNTPAVPSAAPQVRVYSQDLNGGSNGFGGQGQGAKDLRSAMEDNSYTSAAAAAARSRHGISDIFLHREQVTHVPYR